MGPEQFADLAARVSLSGPLIYIGLIMALDPSGFAGILRQVGYVITTLPQRMHGMRLQEPAWPEISGLARRAFRITGATLIGVAVMHLAGLAG